MALQNTRAFLFRGEDTSFGGGAVKEVIWATTAVAAARPLLASLGFVGSTTQLNNLLGASAAANVAAAMGGLSRLVVNRSQTYWVTLNCQLGQANSSAATYTIALPIAPRQMMFLPHNVFAITSSTLSADSAWPLILPPGPSAGFIEPVAGTTAAINYDLVIES